MAMATELPPIIDLQPYEDFNSNFIWVRFDETVDAGKVFATLQEAIYNTALAQEIADCLLNFDQSLEIWKSLSCRTMLVSIAPFPSLPNMFVYAFRDEVEYGEHAPKEPQKPWRFAVVNFGSSEILGQTLEKVLDEQGGVDAEWKTCDKINKEEAAAHLTAWHVLQENEYVWGAMLDRDPMKLNSGTTFDMYKSGSGFDQSPLYFRVTIDE